ncbi:uncharacterized protein LOC119655256 isoform X2 [Hermetia illucens]|uniref:uncharacterized protein LOC119655256 isoform X2 n=1 Tax=Hermetia illucens TaxID=343691 RepID=UPI0018CBF753|nr:uncharacterized protein LOC119655256 isoform X2 [Hermetia illucens]
MNCLPDIDVDRLICAVKSKPVLWDRTCEKYKDKLKTQEAWKDVCIEIVANFVEFDDIKKTEVGKHVLKKWTQVRHSYQKSIAKSKLQFLDKIFEERETEETPSENFDDVEHVTVKNENIQSFPNIPHYATAAKNPESSLNKPASKRNKMDPLELEIIAALKEKPNRHLSFFKGLLPSLEDFDECDTLDFQMEVLKIVKRIRQRKHPPPSVSDIPDAPPSSTLPTDSPSATPSLVANR